MTKITELEREPADALSAVLVDVGLCLVAYELIRSLVVRPVEAFYDNVTFGPGFPFTDFPTDVSSRARHPFDACLLWLRDHMQAISEAQYAAIHEVRKLRNQLAHGIHQDILRHDFVEATAVLTDAKSALFALDNFWVRMDLQADPACAHVDDWSSAHSNSFAMLDILLRKLRHLQ